VKVQTECLPVDPIHHIGVCAGRPIIRDDRGYRDCIQSVWGWLKMQESMAAGVWRYVSTHDLALGWPVAALVVYPESTLEVCTACHMQLAW
jgi:hypothetical protein